MKSVLTFVAVLVAVFCTIGVGSMALKRSHLRSKYDEYSCIQFITNKTMFMKRTLNGNSPSLKKALTAICAYRERPYRTRIQFVDPLPEEPDRRSCKTQSSTYYTVEFPDTWRSDAARAHVASIKRVRMHFCLYPSRNQETPGRVRLTATAFAAPATKIGTSFKELGTSSRRCGWFRNETCFDLGDNRTEKSHFTGRCRWTAVDVTRAATKALVEGQQYMRVHARLDVLDAIGKPVKTCYSLLGNDRRRADARTNIPFISFSFPNSQLLKLAVANNPNNRNLDRTVCRNESGACSLRTVQVDRDVFQALGRRVDCSNTNRSVHNVDCRNDDSSGRVLTYHYCDGVCRTDDVSNATLLSDALNRHERFCQAVYHREPILVTVRESGETFPPSDTRRHFLQWDAKACYCPWHPAYRMQLD